MRRSVLIIWGPLSKLIRGKATNVEAKGRVHLSGLSLHYSLCEGRVVVFAGNPTLPKRPFFFPALTLLLDTLLYCLALTEGSVLDAQKGRGMEVSEAAFWCPVTVYIASWLFVLVVSLGYCQRGCFGSLCSSFVSRLGWYMDRRVVMLHFQ